MKNILVTGGAGFIGSHTCLALLEKGYKVFVIDSFVNSSQKSLQSVLDIVNLKDTKLKENLTVFDADLISKVSIEKVFSDLKESHILIDGIIHFAGLKAVAESIDNPLSYWTANVLGTINLLEIVKKYNCRNFVFSSSATIYSGDNSFFNESSKLKPINPYGNTKLSVEKLMFDISQSKKNNWKIASLRYFNPIGAHPSGLIGEDPKGIPNNIFPLINNTAMGIQKTFKIYGKDWPTIDGTPVRDYIHVMDLAESHIKILEHLFSSDPTYFNLNIGTGKGTSVLQLIETFQRVNKIKVPYVYSDRRNGDLCSVVADNSRLTSKFKIILKRTIEDMCIDGWNWKRLNPNGYL